MVSLGPIVEGYLLIVSKEHIAAFLNIPSKYWDEFLALKEKVGKILTKVYVTDRNFIDITAAHNFVISEGRDRYLLIEDSKTSLYLPQRYLRSQFLCYKFAEAIGMTEQWNWIDNQNWTLINSSIERLAAHFR